jgi:YVTN family beta-propeller protein
LLTDRKFQTRALLLALALAGCGQKPAGPAAPAAYKVYATNERSGSVSVIDGATGEVTATLTVGKRPRGLSLSADGKTLYVAVSGSPIAGPGVDESKLPPPDKAADGIAVVDVASGAVRTVVKGVSDPEQVAAAPDGRLFIASEDTGKAVVFDAAGKLVAEIPVGEEPEGVNLSPDASHAWVTSEADSRVTVIDTRTLKVLGAVTVGARPRNTAFSPDGRRAYVAGEADRVITVIDTKTLAVLNRVTLPDASMRPMGLAVSPDGRRLYVSMGRGGQVVALEAASLSIVGAAKVGARPWGIALSPDGRTLYSANGPSGEVTAIDTATMTVKAAIKVGEGPWGVAIGR